MTGAELIEELRRQPNQKVPVEFRCEVYDRDEDVTYAKRFDVNDVRFDGGSVLLEED